MDRDTKNIIGKGLKLVGQLFENDKNNKEVVQCWLEEHRALRNEMELRLTSIRYMVTLNFSALAIIVSVVLSSITKYELMLLIIPIFSPTIGIIITFHSRRISLLGHYIQNRISPKLMSITGDCEIIGWENYVRNEEEKRNRFLRILSVTSVSLLLIIISSIIALIFVTKRTFIESNGWLVLWSIGLILIVILIIVFINTRKFWFSKKEE